MNKLSAKLKEEMRKLIPPTIYFFVTLHLVVFVRVLMLRETGITIDTSLSVAVAALILGKAVLIADMLPFINRYPHKPLIYNVMWKSTIYVVVAILIHYLERLVEFWREAGGFVAGNQKLLAEIVWPHFWAIQLVITMLVVGYCTMHELTRVMGEARMREMFFGSARGRVSPSRESQ